MKKRIVSLLLAGLMMSTAVACAGGASSDTTAPPAETTSPAGETQAPETTAANVDENGYLLDALPDDLDFKGDTINILYWEDVSKNEFLIELQTGDIFADAIYDRNAATASRLNVEFNWVGTPGNNSNQANFVSKAANSINSGGEYDIFAGYSMTGATMALQGLTQNLLDLDYLNFEQPWWPASLIEETTINNKLFFCSGDIAATMLNMMYGCYVNRDMLVDFNLEDPYDLVKEGKWTVDKMIEMATGIYSDLDGDHAISAGDRYGLIVHPTHVDPYFSAAGLKTVEKGSDGMPIVSPSFDSERTLDLVDKLNKFIHDSGEVTTTGTTKLYPQGTTLFYVERAYNAEANLRDVNFTYGLMPVPKYDEAQENYVTCLSFPYTLYSVSIASPKPDMAAAVIECLASEAYRKVTPAVFEVLMKVRYSANEESAQMYDILRETVSIDLGRIFCATMSNYTYSVFRNAVANKDMSLFSSFASVKKVMERSLESIRKIYE